MITSSGFSSTTSSSTLAAVPDRFDLVTLQLLPGVKGRESAFPVGEGATCEDEGEAEGALAGGVLLVVAASLAMGGPGNGYFALL